MRIVFTIGLTMAAVLTVARTGMAPTGQNDTLSVFLAFVGL